MSAPTRHVDDRSSRPRLGGRRAAAAALSLAALALAVVLGVRAHASSGQPALPKGAPVFRIVEGKTFTGTPYSPATLHIPAGRIVGLRLTDYLGACGLRTVFPGLGAGGGGAAVTVPVGDTRMLAIRAPHPGTYTYECEGHMYFGRIIAS